jgi:hypothetical protein
MSVILRDNEQAMNYLTLQLTFELGVATGGLQTPATN